MVRSKPSFPQYTLSHFASSILPCRHQFQGFLLPLSFRFLRLLSIYLDIHLGQPPSLDIEHETADPLLQLGTHEVAALEDGDVVLDALLETNDEWSSQPF